MASSTGNSGKHDGKAAILSGSVKIQLAKLNVQHFVIHECQGIESGFLSVDGNVTLCSQPGEKTAHLSSAHVGWMTQSMKLDLHYALDLWFEKVFRIKLDGQAMLVRYADDFIVAFQYQRDARQFYHQLAKRLGKFGLDLAGEKTRLLRFSRFEPGRTRRIVFLGFEIYWDVSYRGKLAVHLKIAREKQRSSIKEMVNWIKYNRSRPLQELLAAVKRKLQGFGNYFGLPGNSKSLSRLYYLSVRALYKWLHRRSQRRSYNWLEFTQLLRWFNVRVPAIKKVRYG